MPETKESYSSQMAIAVYCVYLLYCIFVLVVWTKFGFLITAIAQVLRARAKRSTKFRCSMEVGVFCMISCVFLVVLVTTNTSRPPFQHTRTR
ncbi:hypothetical protein J3A83DRAFT_238030 [Scleroderma citrinum]